MENILGFIFLGLGILLLGLYFQKHHDGFQIMGSGGSSMMGSGTDVGSGTNVLPIGTIESNLPGVPLPASVAVPPPATLPETTIDRDTGATLVWKPGRYEVPSLSTPITPVKELDIVSIDLEVRKRFNIIHAYKDPADEILVKYISDPDTFIKLDSLYREVKTYVKHIANMPSLQQYITNATDEALISLRQMIYTANDYTNILYKIYVTFPSIVISSNATLSTKTMTMLDDSVLANSVTMIRQELQQIPGVLSMIQQIKSALMSSADKLRNNPKSNSMEMYEIYLKYTHANELEYMGLNNYIRLISKSKLQNMILMAQNNIIQYLKENIATMDSLLNKVKNLPNINESDQSSIETRRETYNDLLNTANSDYAKMQSVEPFQSYSNPYVAPSISTEQAKEFSLRKREGFQSVKNPYRTVS